MKCRNEPVARGPDGRKVREVVATLNGVALPTGTDPESQPSAAPMRNRLTARKAKATEEVKEAKREREVEIEELKRTLQEVRGVL